jgi:small conductance mechanosensitive channel
MRENQEMREFFNQAGDLAVPYGLNLVGALVLLIGGWIVAGWARRSLRRLLDRASNVDETLKPVIASVARYGILIFVLIAVLAQFGIHITSIIAVLGAVGLAIGLALQGTLQNIAAGIMLLFLRPFRIGDYIDAEGIAGTIDEVGLFTTQMHTYDGVYLEVPNGQLWSRAIRNYSRLPTRRLDIVVSISYADDIDKTQAVLMDLLENDARAHGDPAPQVMVNELAESSVNLGLRCWTDAGDYWSLRFDLTKTSKQRLDAEGITIPVPQRDVHLHQAES